MTKKMAIVVIHGIGEQKPFETLDAFAQGLEKEYGARGVNVTLKHDLVWFGDWGESCISFIPKDAEYKQIDIFEYYWSQMTQRKITAAEVTDWIFQVAHGANSHYKKEGKDPANYKHNKELFKKDGEFKMSEYLAQIVSMGGYLRYLKLLFPLMDVYPLTKTIMQRLLNTIKRPLSRALVDYVGDIALYCTADVKSEYYATRTQILNGAADKVKLLAMNDKYDEILICGHSLGSVIAYDVIDRMNQQMQHDIALRGEKDKFKGMVTFGSPLDKVAFFFDEYIDSKKQPIRYTIVSFLHGFRRKDVDNPIRVKVQNDGGESQTIEIGTTMQQYLSEIPWLNFWTTTDVISGHLDIYENVKNIDMNFATKSNLSPLSTMKLFITSHTHYWKAEKLYNDIVSNFMQSMPPKQVSNQPNP